MREKFKEGRERQTPDFRLQTLGHRLQTSDLRHQSFSETRTLVVLVENSMLRV
jgi:hypothetical protein